MNSAMADVENVVSEKKKKLRRKNKKNWRKNADVADVDEYLEERRREERTGGIVSEKQDEELFFVEKKAVTDVSEIPKGPAKDRIKNAKTDESSDEEEYVPRSVLLKKKRQKEAVDELKQQAKIPKICNDAWVQEKVKETKNIWLEDTFKKEPKKPKTVGEKLSSLPAVNVCDSGASYNPEYENHQELLQKALDDELEIAKKQEKLNRKIKFLSQEEYKQNPSWIDEMSEGLQGENTNNEKLAAEKQQIQGEEEIVLPKTVLADDRKTRKQRRKEKERTEEERAKESEKRNNARLNDVYRLRTLKKEIKSEEMKKEMKKLKKEEIMKKKANEPKRLGKQKFEKPKVVFSLSEELSGSLRGLKPEGDPFLDRMKSFEKRNILEPRKRVVPHRKYKLKEQDKRSYKKPTVKDFTSKTT